MAVVSLTFASDALLTVFTRAFGLQWGSITLFVARASAQTFNILNRIMFVNAVFISVDRWLSVEFAIFYRTQISKRKIQICIVAIWVLGLAMGLPAVIFFTASGLHVFCNAPWNFVMHLEPGNHLHLIASGLLRFPFLTMLVFLFQLRILIIAVTTKLRLLRIRMSNRQAHEARPAGGGAVVRIVWSTLRGSMAMVVTLAISDIPVAVLEYVPGLNAQSIAPLVQMKNMIPVAQYVMSPFIYLVFFQQFRETAKRLFGCGGVCVSQRRFRHRRVEAS